MNCQVLDPRLADPLDEGERVRLVGQEPDLARDGHREGADEAGEDCTELVGGREEAGAGTVVRRERLGAAAVEVNAGDVLLDRQRRLDGEIWIGRTDLLEASVQQRRVVSQRCAKGSARSRTSAAQ